MPLHTTRKLGKVSACDSKKKQIGAYFGLPITTNYTDYVQQDIVESISGFFHIIFHS